MVWQFNPALFYKGTCSTYNAADSISKFVKLIKVFFGTHAATAGYDDIRFLDVVPSFAERNEVKTLHANVFRVKVEWFNLNATPAVCNAVRLFKYIRTDRAHLWTMIWRNNFS